MHRRGVQFAYRASTEPATVNDPPHALHAKLGDSSIARWYLSRHQRETTGAHEHEVLHPNPYDPYACAA